MSISLRKESGGIHLNKTVSAESPREAEWAAVRSVLSRLKARGLSRLRIHNRVTWTGKIVVLGAIGTASVLWLFRPELAGPIQHVLQNVTQPTVKVTNLNGVATEINRLASGSLGIVISVAALLIGLATGIMKQSAAPVFAGVALAVTLHFGPEVMGSVVAGSQNLGSGVTKTQVIETRYAEPLIAATRLDVESQTHPLDPAQIHTLRQDVDWVVQHPKGLKVEHGKAVSYGASSLDSLVYRLSLPLLSDLRPAQAQRYVQHIRRDQQKNEADELGLLELAGLSGLLTAGLFLTGRKGRRNLQQVQTILEGLPGAEAVEA